MSEQNDWLQMELAELTLSREDFPAKTCPSQESAPACPVSAAACGPSFSELSLRFDPVGQSLKMSLGLELSALTGCSLTWQEQGTPRGRWWWVLSMPELRTGGSGFGLLRTPLQSDAEKQGHGNLSHQVKTMMLPTPSTTSYGRNKGGANPDGPERPSLETMAKGGMLPTPRANKRGFPDSHGNVSMYESIAGGTGPQRLSPCFVEWMMGYPAGWTDVSD